VVVYTKPINPPHHPITTRLVHKVRGAAASAQCEVPPTAAECARLDGMSLEELRAEFKAASENFSRGSSAFRGVSWHKRENKWRATFKNLASGKQGETMHDTEEEAARAYDARARLTFGR